MYTHTRTLWSSCLRRTLCVAARELTEDEKYKIERSEDYISFLDRSARIIERAIDENNDVDIFTDYTGKYSDDFEG